MIEFVVGTLRQKQPHRVVLEVASLGIEVLIPFSSFSALPPEGQVARLLTHLHWREEGPQLFGFVSAEERELFRRLTRVSKIGPKLAVAILSAAPPAKLVGMILAEDVKGLSGLKGVGAKTASRLVVELKESLAELGFGEPAPAVAGPPPLACEADVRDALYNLGYTTREIDPALLAVRASLPPGADASRVLAAVLRRFGAPT